MDPDAPREPRRSAERPPSTRVPARRVPELTPPIRYALAVAIAIVSIVLRLALDPVWGTKLPYITLFPAIMVSAWLGGVWPGLVTTGISAAAAYYNWLEPAGTWAVLDPRDLLGLIVFISVGLVISVLNEAWRRASTRVTESERRLDATLGSIGDAVIATDHEGRVVRLNPVAEHLTGWTMPDAYGRPVEDVFVIINEQSRQTVENPVQRVLREGTVTGLANHTLLIARDGREVPIDDSAAPIRTDDNRVTGAIMVFRDISERRRTEAEQHRHRKQALFLSEVGATLASSLDYEQTLDTIASLAVPAIADWCAVDVVTDDGDLRRVATAHVDPARVELARRIEQRYPADPAALYGAHEVMRTGKSTMMADVPDALLVQSARDPEHLRMLREVGIRSYMCVPMIVHGRTLGVLTLVTEAERRFGEADLRFAELIAMRAGLAVANSLAYREARRLTERLREVTTLLEDAESITHLGSWAWDIATNKVTWSTEMYQVYGLEPGSAAPTYDDFLSYVHPEDRALVDEAVRRSFQSLQPFAFDHRIVRPDGTERTLHAEGRVIPGEDGKAARMVGSGHDITEQALARSERERLVSDLATANQVKMQFLARMSHELRTPLNAIFGYADLLALELHGPLTPDQARDLGRIRHSSGYLLNLINDILNFAKIEAGQVALRLSPVRLRDVFAAVEALVAPQAAVKGITYHHLTPDDIAVTADADRVEQVLLNLISNAIKFTETGGRVTLECQADDRVAWISVSDTGHGIPTDKLRAIFDPFVQLADARAANVSGAGLGLGLSISTDLVRHLGGELTVESVVGKGSTFRFWLPLVSTRGDSTGMEAQPRAGSAPPRLA